MNLSLTDAAADELRGLLDDAIRDLSASITATDNPEYRRVLRNRRDKLQEVRAALNQKSEALD